MLVLYVCMIMAYRSDNGLEQDIKATEVVCYSAAMYVSYDMVVEDGKYAKTYEFSHHMHPQTALGSMLECRYCHEFSILI
jgi:hypothetical protein